MTTIPLAFYVHVAFPGLEAMLGGKDTVTGVLLVAASIALGFIVEDLGSRFECIFERVYQRLNAKTVSKDQFEQDWYEPMEDA